MRLAFFGIAACAFAFGGCLIGKEETDKQKALKSYTACLRQAASRLDDGESTAETVAVKISPACSAEFRNVIRVNNDRNSKGFDEAMQLKQLDFAATIVRDGRKGRLSN